MSETQTQRNSICIYIYIEAQQIYIHIIPFIPIPFILRPALSFTAFLLRPFFFPLPRLGSSDTRSTYVIRLSTVMGFRNFSLLLHPAARPPPSLLLFIFDYGYRFQHHEVNLPIFPT